MTKILYTVCSANHLAYAKTMADSFLQHHTDYTIFICLADKIENRFDINLFTPHNLIEVETIAIAEFDRMSTQYSLIELNCALKPFFANYLIEKYNPEMVVYLDSDIYVYQSFHIIEEFLQEKSIVLTPHFLTPITDNLLPRERDILRSGLYNAGFIALKINDISKQFLTWWSNHLIDECYYNFAEGMGVDQTWLNLVPLFFNEVYIAKNKGLNVAYWNLHERTLSIKNNTVVINETEPLIFLHISGYKFETPEILSRHQNRFDLKKLPVLFQLLSEYQEKVKANNYNDFIVLPGAYTQPAKQSTGLMKTINKWIKPLGIKISDL
ncbi:MAG: hypothetical protein JSR09_10480 [Bacteroidetes bacterium]|nr:hypothetical protein [Bacteroidota bacterium]MBS1650116.1 hypothetical protein [Bacteroidota bacterium]